LIPARWVLRVRQHASPDYFFRNTSSVLFIHRGGIADVPCLTAGQASGLMRFVKSSVSIIVEFLRPPDDRRMLRQRIRTGSSRLVIDQHLEVSGVVARRCEGHLPHAPRRTLAWCVSLIRGANFETTPRVLLFQLVARQWASTMREGSVPSTITRCPVPASWRVSPVGITGKG